MRIDPVLMIVFPYLAVALTVLVTVSHHSRLKKCLGDERGMRLYFSLFFVLLAAVPLLLVLLADSAPAAALGGLGLQVGRGRIGVILLLIGTPVVVVLAWLSSGRPEMRRQYPFSKTACAGTGRFVRYELAYVLLYYTAWEFLYRGVLFFPLLPALGFLGAASLSTAVSVLHHTGHPDSEVAGALLGGFIFCAVALLTRSILYSLVLHALLGVADDTFIYLRCYRRGAAGTGGPPADR